MTRGSPISAAYQNLLSKGRLNPNPGQAALANQLGHLQQNLTVRGRWWKHNNAASSNGVYIYGGVGTGKSRIADLFAATLPSHVTRRRTHFFEFMMDTHMRLHRARSEANYAGDPLTRIGREIQRESSVLCLDEFQVSDIADAMMLKRLFELYKNGLNRPLFLPFIEELQQRCLVFRMEGDHDYRLDGQKQHTRPDIFFVNAEEFQNSLSVAMNGAALEQVEIPVVMNRKLKIDAAHPPTDTRNATSTLKPVVSTTFSTLCEAFLGASDYHALCNFASTIYLSGLRQFASDELDVVRRFITLVDIAYESRTRVLCLSTEPVLKTFENIILSKSPRSHDGNSKQASSEALATLREVLQDQNLTVKGEGGSSSSMMSTFINDVEWSATGLKKASLATGGAGETDVRFAIGRAISRLSEMGSVAYGVGD
ncbi:hypothetical protein LTR70_002261 [Exophiala xenobiotica]|uniref:AFG1-like ATPase n=1 Tax=Lithohypha guttulata TaxID=1690604 RepID=A0ABR0KL78_9EURO|nr:hypothetical protein LTR24_001318 [Lithohypha guttulata]KAK5325996.1 hypothetical protein LTR70_002261 [Exophiala xenobiotica]